MTQKETEELRILEKRISESATNLRADLEELSNLISQQEDETYNVPNWEEYDDIYDSYDLQDWADEVAEIENKFFTE